jgi:hypothetical protein
MTISRMTRRSLDQWWGTLEGCSQLLQLLSQLQKSQYAGSEIAEMVVDVDCAGDRAGVIHSF